MKKQPLITITILSLVFLFGCAAQMKQFKDMSPKERAIFFMNIYNKEVDNYATQTTEDKVAGYNEDQLKLIRKKHEILSTMFPIIRSYNAMVTLSVEPKPEDEQMILKLIDELMMLGI